MVGIILNNSAYRAEYGTSFARPTKLPIYDAAIQEEAQPVVCARMEAEHKARRADYKIYETAKRESQQFILAVVEDTWVRELKSSSTFYARVKAKDLLDHLQATCTGLHALYVLTLQNEMQTYHQEVEGIPEYINMLKDARRGQREPRT